MIFKNPVKFKQADLLVAYLSGQQIQYTTTRNPSENSSWYDLPAYEFAQNVYRLTCKYYSFRVKPE